MVVLPDPSDKSKSNHDKSVVISQSTFEIILKAEELASLSKSKLDTEVNNLGLLSSVAPKPIVTSTSAAVKGALIPKAPNSSAPTSTEIHLFAQDAE